MQKSKALKMLSNNGDSLVFFKNGAPIVATVDFTTPYVRDMPLASTDNSTGITIFNWTYNKKMLIDPGTIAHIKPLAEVLQNG